MMTKSKEERDDHIIISRSSKVIHVRIRSSKFSSTNQCTSNIQQKSSSSLTTKTSQLSDYKSVINNLQHSAESKWINKSDVVDDHHRRLKKEKAKKCSRRRIVASLVIGFCLLILILVAILIPLLITIKPTKKNIYPDGTPLLRWHSDGITIAGVSSVSGTTANLLNYPYDLVVDWEYTLYVADRSNNRIQKFLRGSSNGITVAGQANGAAGVSADAFSSSAFLLVDDDGNVNISDANNNRVMFWQKNAAKGTMVAGDGTLGNSTNQLNMPHGLAYDGQSNTLFVGDLYNHRVMKYSYHNTSGILFAGDNTPGTSRTQLWSPHGLFFEQSSNSILIANAQAHNIVRWVLGDSQWSIVVGNSNGIGGSSSSFLYLPTDIMLDPMKNIYVVDRGNNRVQFFPFGQLNATTIAGKTGILGSNATLLNIPNSLTLDNQLNLYVADWQNHRIQKFLRY